MKTQIFRFNIFLFCLLILCSCRDKSSHIPQITATESIMELNPKSAPAIMESITKPESLEGESYARYALRMTQALDINNHTSTSDSLIRVR